MKPIKDFKTLEKELIQSGAYTSFGIMQYDLDSLADKTDIKKVHEIYNYINGYIDALAVVRFLDKLEYTALKNELKSAFSSASDKCIYHLAGKG